jgi:hypothetical protein
MGRHEKRLYGWLMAMVMVGAATMQVLAQAPAEGTYQPKFAGDPAHSESEAGALAYMRTFLRAEHAYKKKHGKYAETMSALAGTGSFTKRMASTKDRGDYMVGFRTHKDKGSDTEGFVLTMTPKKLDGEHRSFYAEDDGVIHADDQKAADAESPKLR